MAKYVHDQRAWEDLANAIIELAVLDYREALVWLRDHPESKSAEQQVEEAEGFFRSARFGKYTDLNPEYLIKKIKKIVSEEES